MKSNCKSLNARVDSIRTLTAIVTYLAAIGGVGTQQHTAPFEWLLNTEEN